MSTKQTTASTTSQSQQRDPYAPAVPGLQSAAAGITQWMNDPASATAYSGPRVAGMSDVTRAGIDRMASGGGLGQAETYLTGLIGNNSINPWLEDVRSSVRASVMPSINSRISQAGMAPGSSVDQALTAREMTNALAAPTFNAYENAAQRQLQAAGMLPAISNARTSGMIGAGQLLEGYDQRNIDAQRQAWEEQRLAALRPYQEASPLLLNIGNAGGTSSSSGTTTQTQTTQPSPVQMALGAGMMGASMFSPMGMFGQGGFFGNPTTIGGLFGRPVADPSWTAYRSM